ncbi:hypothetical protein LCGC14_0391470 [marine sediment metagenome]|uniref:DUF1565 domain-containing protein n=1 Tax=marine sediment metagenome TaxID=412755 RepID=A0A0F9VLJ7_9ZZZZ
MVTQVGAISRTVQEPDNSAVATRHELAMPGTVRYVSSVTGSSSGPGTVGTPYATVDQAINESAAGDTIFVLEGHTEDITLATEFVPDVAGLKIIGLGRGARRPTITFDETTGNIPISGAGTLLENFLFTISGTKDVVIGITITGADVKLKDIELREAAATDQFVDAISISTGAARCEIDGYKFTGVVAGDATQTALLMAVALDGLVLKNLWIVGEFATAAVEGTAACTRMFMENLNLQQEGTVDPVLTIHANTTGVGVNINLGNITADDAGFLAALTASNKVQWFGLKITNAQGMHAGEEAIPAAKGWASGPAQIA